MTAHKPAPPQPISDDSTDAGAVNIKPGIYLEEKKSSIGTGGTAKTAEYRTFWVTLCINETHADLVLLDDDFRPTGIKKKFSHDTILGEGWHFIAEGEKRYQKLRPLLDRLLTPPTTPAKPTAAKPAAANWWGGDGANQTAKDPFTLDKKPLVAPKKGNWYDK